MVECDFKLTEKLQKDFFVYVCMCDRMCRHTYVQYDGWLLFNKKQDFVREIRVMWIRKQIWFMMYIYLSYYDGAHLGPSHLQHGSNIICNFLFFDNDIISRTLVRYFSKGRRRKPFSSFVFYFALIPEMENNWSFSKLKNFPLSPPKLLSAWNSVWQPIFENP